MVKFDIVEWLRISRGKRFENENEAFQYLVAHGDKNKIFNDLCIDGIYDPQNGYDQILLPKIGERYAKQHSILAYYKDDINIVLAITDPFDVDIIDDLRSKLGGNLLIFLAKKNDIQQVFEQPVIEENICCFVNNEQKEAISDPSIDHLLDCIVVDAIQLRVSDIHFENNINGMRIRGRIDGKLFILREVDYRLACAIISGIKLRSGLKIDETRLSQDGRIRFVSDGNKCDIRVSIIPTIYGENIVLRIFNNTHADFSLENIGLNNSQLECLKSLSNIDNGLILVAGPTGSGKTTTLYALLKHIFSSEKKIVTVEDPIEYKLEHINQVSVNEEIGLSFIKIIRALLRQAPNVIFIGEIRDADTAQATIQAALTGHLVLSSIHSNTTEETIIHLRDLGIFDYLINSCIRAIIAQRLVRLKCPDCQQYSLQSKICSKCFGRGYFGRTGVFEILLNNELFNNLSPSRYENFGFLCKLHDELEHLYHDGILFNNDHLL